MNPKGFSEEKHLNKPKHLLTYYVMKFKSDLINEFFSIIKIKKRKKFTSKERFKKDPETGIFVEIQNTSQIRPLSNKELRTALTFGI